MYHVELLSYSIMLGQYSHRNSGICNQSGIFSGFTMTKVL